MSRNLKELIRQMTLEEKAGLCSGADFWNTMGDRKVRDSFRYDDRRPARSAQTGRNGRSSRPE